MGLEDSEKKAPRKKAQLKQISQSSISRSLSILNMSVSATAKFAAFKMSNLFSDEDLRSDRQKKFLIRRVEEFVSQVGKLKGSLMKAGQLLSIYGDHFLPKEIRFLLNQLHNQTQSLAWPIIHKSLIQQIGNDRLRELDVDEEPLAAASLAQVHRAVIRQTGQSIALKIQYPGVERAITSDIATLKSLLELSRMVRFDWRFEEAFKEIKVMLTHETDYLREVKAMEKFRAALRGDDRFVIPTVYDRYSTKRIIALTFEAGLPLDHPSVIGLAQYRRNRLAASFLDLLFQETFAHRLIQTDPHFGNYLIRLDEGCDKIVLFDFGAMRRLSKGFLEVYRQLVEASMFGDQRNIVRSGEKMGFLEESDDANSRALFVEMCITIMEPFREEFDNPDISGAEGHVNSYDWHNSDVMARTASLGRQAVFSFRLRPPPAETLFLLRKIIGMAVVVSRLEAKFGPRSLLLTRLADSEDPR